MKHSKTTKKQAHKEYIDPHQKEWEHEMVLERAQEQQIEEWERQQETPKWNDWSKMDMLDDYAEM